MKPASLGLVVLLAACGSGGPTDPQSRIPPTGVYDYSFASAQGGDKSGTVTISYATADSLNGTVSVPGIDPAFDYVGRANGSYEFFLIPSPGALIDNRVTWNGTRMTDSCTYIDVNGGRVSYRATCTLVAEGSPR